MNKLLPIILLSIFSLTSYAQVSYDPGYFIDNNGIRTSCLIRNADKSRNPTQFEYKLSENSEVKVATISSVREFAILNTVHKYLRATVSYYNYGSTLGTLSNAKEIAPKEQEEVFLRVLVQGKASLYFYYDNNGRPKYFYNLDNSKIEQLIFYQYLTDDNKIAENNDFKQQLWKSLKCQTFNPDYFNALTFRENDLIRAFVDYNKCVQAEYIDYVNAAKKKNTLNFLVKAGINSSSLNITQYTKSGVVYTQPMGQKFSLTIGVELEYVLPSNKNKWSLFIDPAFQTYKSTNTDFAEYNSSFVPSSGSFSGAQNVSLTTTYNYITFPVGVERRFFINDNAMLFLKGAVAAFNYILNSSKAIKINSNYPDLGQKSFVGTPEGFFAIGYKYKNKFSIEGGYQFDRILLKNSGWKIDYGNSISLTLGYQLN